jgi:cadmium resistance protein CadD (predicted permease)
LVDAKFLPFLFESMSVASLAAVAYGSTNLDNLVLLSAYSVKPGYRSSLVRLTFVFACLIVLLVSFLLARAADDHFLARQMHYLGAIPLTLGLWQLLQLALGRAGDDEPQEGLALGSKPIRTGLAAYASFALVLLANSGDSIGVMTPLLADLQPSLVMASFAAAVIVAIVMSWLAKFLARHPVTRLQVQRVAKWALPFLLIGIGLMILSGEPSGVFFESGFLLAA